jgi:hypothetical protein
MAVLITLEALGHDELTMERFKVSEPMVVEETF